MFFYISKLLWFCLQPSALLLILLISGTALLATRHQKAGRRLVLASAALLFIGGVLPLSTWLILPLEQRFARVDLSGDLVDGIVVLGGMEDARVSSARRAHALNEAAERLTETAALARRFPDAKIVLTSGAIEIVRNPTLAPMRWTSFCTTLVSEKIECFSNGKHATLGRTPPRPRLSLGRSPANAGCL